MTSSPITPWHLEGETMETVTDFIFSGSKITAGGDCSHEVKRRLLFGRKAMANSIKKQSHYFATKVCLVKAMVFPVVVYGCESWTIKKASTLWCFWESFGLQGDEPVHPKGDQSWMFIGRTDAEAETLILWPPDVKNWLIGKNPDAGNDWRQEEKRTTGWDGWMASPTRWTWVWVSPGSWWWTGKPGVQSMGSPRVGCDWATELKEVRSPHWNVN